MEKFRVSFNTIQDEQTAFDILTSEQSDRFSYIGNKIVELNRNQINLLTGRVVFAK